MKDFLAQNKFLLKFMFLAICGGLSVGISQITINLYAVHLKATSAQIGLIGGARSIGVIATVLPIGVLIDHFGAKKIYVIGGLIGSLIYLFLPLARTPQLLIIATAAIGLFMSSRFVSMNSVFLDYLKVVGNDKAGWYRGSNSIGLVFLGPLLGVYLLENIGYGWTFVTISLSLIITVVIARAILADTKRDNDIVAFSFNGTFGHIRSLLRNKELVEASLAEALAIAAFSCFNTFIIVIALRVFHLSKEVAALLLSAEGGVFILAVFCLDILLKKIGQRNFYLFSISIIILGLALLGGAKNALYLWVGTIFLGIGLGMSNIINVSRIANIDTKKGKVAGFFTLFTITGAMLGPILGGFVGAVFGLQAIFWVLVPLFFILGLKIYFKPNTHIRGYLWTY
jgi:MFS family permease